MLMVQTRLGCFLRSWTPGNRFFLPRLGLAPAKGLVGWLVGLVGWSAGRPHPQGCLLLVAIESCSGLVSRDVGLSEVLYNLGLV